MSQEKQKNPCAPILFTVPDTESHKELLRKVSTHLPNPMKYQVKELPTSLQEELREGFESIYMKQLESPGTWLSADLMITTDQGDIVQFARERDFIFIPILYRGPLPKIGSFNLSWDGKNGLIITRMLEFPVKKSQQIAALRLSFGRV